MAICANQRRTYMGTARRYMEEQHESMARYGMACEAMQRPDDCERQQCACQAAQPCRREMAVRPVRQVPREVPCGGRGGCGWNERKEERRMPTCRSCQCGCQARIEGRRPSPGCLTENLCPDLPLGVAYVSPQPYTGLVNPEMALSRGSAFNNLYDPWKPGKACSC